MRFILIANNNEIKEDLIDKINILHDDIIILFNHHYPIKFDKIKNHPNKILLMRYLSKEKKMLGIDEYYENKKYFKLVLSYYGSSESNLRIYREFDTKFNTITNNKSLINNFINSTINSKNYKLGKNKTFSTGFLGYLFSKYYSRGHLREIFKIDITCSKIFLIGFTGIYPQSQYNPYHNFDQEQKYYEIDKNNKLLEIINPIDINKSLISIINSFLVDPSLKKHIYPITNEIKPIIEFKEQIQKIK